MTLVLRVRLQNSVRSRVVTRRVHSIRARLVKGCLERLSTLESLSRDMFSNSQGTGHPS